MKRDRPLPPPPAGFPGGYVPVIGTVGEDGRVTLAPGVRKVAPGGPARR
mgnify:CR=1 FL=1